MINSAISAFLNNNNSDIDIQECFDEIFSGVCEPLNAGAFLSLLKQKGENLSDVLAGIKSASQALKKINIAQGEDIIENIVINPPGNMFDISLGVDIIVSASGVGVVKTALPDYLIQNTSFKTLEKLGINIEKLTPDNFEETKFIYSYIDKNSPYLKYTKELQRVLPYDSILKTINKFLNPYGAKNCTLALSSYNKVEEGANLCLNLGYINSVVFSSGKFSYVSIERETKVSEAWKNKIFSYSITPELLGIEPNPEKTLEVENEEQSAEIIQGIFENKIKNSNYDVLIINAALSLYIVKRADSLLEGLNMAKKIISSNLALEKLNQLKKL